MTATEDADLARSCDVPREPDATRAQDASFPIQFHQWPDGDRFDASSLLSAGIPARVTGMLHVVILQKAFPGLIANRAVDRMMKQQELHGVPYCLIHSSGVRANDHPLGDRRGA